MSNVAKSQVMNKLKSVAKGAWKRARGVEAKARGGGGFPPNLKGLVAACQTYKFATTNTPKKDPYFALTCIVKDPEEYVGRRATFMWFINESEYATVEDNLEQLSNDLQLLGLDMPEDIEDVVGLLADLCERGVHLVFNTGGPRKNDRPPNLFIQGLAADWPDEPQEGAGEVAERGAKGKAKAESNGDAGDEGDTADAEAAEAGDPAGFGDGSDQDWLPEKGQEYYYTPPKGKKALYTVTAVNVKKRTLTLKGGKPPREFKDLSFDDPKITGE